MDEISVRTVNVTSHGSASLNSKKEKIKGSQGHPQKEGAGVGDGTENITDKRNADSVILNHNVGERTVVRITSAEPKAENQKNYPGYPHESVILIIGFRKIPIDPGQTFKIEGHRGGRQQVAGPLPQNRRARLPGGSGPHGSIPAGFCLPGCSEGAK